MRNTGRPASEVEDALWELVAAGLVTADGFENLRALIDPHRRRGEGRRRPARPGTCPGRWALLRHGEGEPPEYVERFARQLLQRWGVVFRDIAARETLAPPWRDILVVLRRMETRGEIRGGRFAAAFVGEQFALPEALDLLRAVRRAGEVDVEWDALPPWLAGRTCRGGSHRFVTDSATCRRCAPLCPASELLDTGLYQWQCSLSLPWHVRLQR